ncbi:hypothetical protein CASFOL_025501 [Castilleja foliolosa]|uniref:Uncharacterized protein n=1 Tax=Castilleja foliolosa TaxID=1961234 RepID=A0ABD3CSA5_9LAMI
MEDRRRQKQANNNNRRSRNKRPPRGNNWHRTVPKWEKEFCKVVGSLDWETLLQMKKFTHMYEDVINWNDSAGEEAFYNAKKRFWAEINGLYCHLPLPDPDLYIDNINWDSEIDTDSLSDVETEFNPHEPVVIFGDSLLPNPAYSLAGWGDDEANFKVPVNNNNSILYDNRAVFGSSDYSNHAWGFEDGWNDGWNLNYTYTDNNAMYRMGPDTEREMAYVKVGPWNDSNVADMTIEERHNAREWNSFNSYGSVSHHAAITVGQTWNH